MNNYKKDFPLLNNSDIAYLDNAATTQRPFEVIEAEREFYSKLNANPLRGVYDLAVSATDAYENARETVASFIGANSSREIIFTRNTTESINLVAFSYGLNFLTPDDEILITVMEHHSNMLPWQMVARKTGAKLKYLYCSKEGEISNEDIDKLVTNNTKLAAIGQVSNVLGTHNPISYIIDKVHKVGGIVLIDGAQSVPHMRVNVSELDADFIAFSGHKIYAPLGIGVLYGKQSLLEKMPPFLRGGEMIESVTLEGATYAELPHKFEAGTVNAGSAHALKAAIEYVSIKGLDKIEERELLLTRYAMEKMSHIPHVNILGSKDPALHTGIISFTIDDVHPHDVASILNEDKICVRAGHHCAQPLLKHLGVYTSTRLSLSFYNDEDDIDRFIKSLQTVRGLMGYGQ